MAQTTMTFRVDDSLKKDFDRLCDEFGLSNTAALTIFMKTMVRERRIPFEVKEVIVSSLLSHYDDTATVVIMRKVITGGIIPIYNEGTLNEPATWYGY